MLYATNTVQVLSFVAVALRYAFILRGNQLKYNNYDLTKSYNLLDLIKKE